MTTLTDLDFLALAQAKDPGVQRIVDVETSTLSGTYFLLAEHTDGCRNVIAVNFANPTTPVVHPETELHHVQRQSTRGETAKRIWSSREFGARATEQRCDQHVCLAWRAQL